MVIFPPIMVEWSCCKHTCLPFFYWMCFCQRKHGGSFSKRTHSACFMLIFRQHFTCKDHFHLPAKIVSVVRETTGDYQQKWTHYQPAKVVFCYAKVWSFWYISKDSAILFNPQDAVKKKVIPKVIRDPNVAMLVYPPNKMAKNIQRFFRYTRMTAKKKNWLHHLSVQNLSAESGK